MNPNSLGEHIKKRRIDLGLTQREVARRIGANPWTLGNWEKGKTQPAKRFIAAITDFITQSDDRQLSGGKLEKRLEERI